MIRPVAFAFNQETAVNNAFQQSETSNDAQHLALGEFNHMVQLLTKHGIQVIVVNDTPVPHTPDSIFPNNWFSTHEEGIMTIYPLFASNRRPERRADIAQLLSDHFVMFDLVDYTAHEADNEFLEGTGSMVLDRDLRICYAGISSRTNKKMLTTFCNKFGYELIAFHTQDADGNPIYHTNVVMSVGDRFIIVCLEAIPNETERNILLQSTSKEIIPISLQQMNNFAGNMLEVINEKNEHFVVMSNRAYDSLTPRQITSIEEYATILHSDLSTIEKNGGGSARCMMAEIFLKRKSG